MRLLLSTIIVGAALAGSMPASASAQADPFVGTWKLNLAKSKFTPGPAPKSSTVMIEAAAGGLKVSAKGVDAEGKAMTSGYTATTDGKDAAATGSDDYDMVSVKQVDPSHRIITRKKGGKAVQTTHSLVSKDGKTLTATTTGTNAKGQQVNNVAVYDKQ